MNGAELIEAILKTGGYDRPVEFETYFGDSLEVVRVELIGWAVRVTLKDEICLQNDYDDLYAEISRLLADLRVIFKNVRGGLSPMTGPDKYLKAEEALKELTEIVRKFKKNYDM